VKKSATTIRIVAEQLSVIVRNEDSERQETGLALMTAVDDFVSSVESLREFASLIAPILHQNVGGREIVTESEIVAKIQAAIYSFKPPAAVVKSEDPASKSEPSGVDQKKSYNLDLTDGTIARIFLKRFVEIFRLADKQKKQALQVEHLYNSTLVALVSSVESFLSSILHVFYDKYPASLGDDYRFSLSELRAFADIRDAEAAAIDRRIDNVLSQSFVDCMKSTLGLAGASKDMLGSHMSELCEIYQRRHVHVHCGGRVDTRYLAVVDPKKVGELKQGDKLTVTDSYLQSAIDTVKMSMLLVANQFWKCIDKSDHRRDAVLMMSAYRDMAEGRWPVAEAVYGAFEFDKQISEDSRIRAKVNLWLCNKRQGRFNEIKPIIQQADFSALDPRFRMVRFVLLDELEPALNELKLVLASASTTPDEMREWPILEELRTDKRFEELLAAFEARTRRAKSGGSEQSPA
jgi:hypothetical protein